MTRLPRSLKIELDDEEIAMLIDFQESAANDADESLEHEEAKERRQRAAGLKKLRKLAEGRK